METYEIRANILISGVENVAQFIMDFTELIEEYGGELVLSEDSDVEVVYMTEEDEPGIWTLQDLYDGEIQ